MENVFQLNELVSYILLKSCSLNLMLGLGFFCVFKDTLRLRKWVWLMDSSPFVAVCLYFSVQRVK